ncbi:SsgA family sporulation/cell division regulator [Planomonospora sp. ID67723]|uniref:SsgA family sporulation/cell division regulator n=1 Tax=Planomonospora sp. ID67723 TaxID=2738134 RepID=UPI0018C35794|nr:SsgA family sporulation/cell division regulator [Planomonospora sp. ID67723]MBG0828209.1 SsgA family sporulation/cell division regulator [Planomonospora sp. ID67723]
MSTSQIRTTLQVCFVDRPNQAFTARAVYELTDPYAVQLHFPAPGGTSAVIWTFARDLLVRGLDEAGRWPLGQGDVSIGPAETGDYVEITLFPHGPAPRKLFARRDELTSFVAQIYRRVPNGREDEWIDWSAAWSRLYRELGRAA